MSNTWLDLLTFQGPAGPEGPQGPAPTFAGDLTGSSATQSVIHLTGDGGELSTPATFGTISENTDRPIRYASDNVQTTSGTPTRVVSTIAISIDTSCKITAEVHATGAVHSWTTTFYGLWRRTGTGSVVEEISAQASSTGGLLTGASATMTVSGNNVIVTVTGPSSDVDWKCNWLSADALHAAPSISPYITSVVPNHGAQDGSTSVQIFGGNFTGVGETVTFDGTTAGAITYVSPTEIDCDPPAHAGGTVNVLVTNANGDSGSTGNGAYTYDASDFDPTTFGGGTLTFYCRGDTVHVASGKVDDTLNGGSNGDSFTNAGGGSGAQPTWNASGSANSRPSWTFDGSNDILLSSTAFSNFFSSTTGTMLLVFNCATWPTTDSATSYLNAGILVTQGGYFGIYARNVGGTTPAVVGGAYDGGDVYAQVTTGVAANTPILVTLVLNGGNLSIQVNQGTAATDTCGSLSPGASMLNMGAGYSGSPTGVEMMTAICYSSGNVTSLSTLQSQIMAYYGL